MGREWTKRLWTYQEILLASNPVVVCGDVHLSWSRLASSIIFLDFYYKKMFALKTWTRLVLARNRLFESDTGGSTHGTSSQLELTMSRTYESFLSGLHAIEHAAYFGTAFISGLSVPAIINFSLLLGSSRVIGFLLAFSLITFSLSLLYILTSPPTLRSRSPLAMPEDDLVDGICSRRARDPKDKAFAVRAVLQRLLKRDLPSPDYQVSTEEIYTEMSVHLIQATESLDLLLPAALSSSPGQPSWVPDWSKELPDFWKDHRPRDGYSSRAYWKWDPENSGVLSVQGRPLQTIVSCFKFQETSDVYLESEAAIHLQNLRTMQTFLHECKSKNQSVSDTLLILSIPGNWRSKLKGRDLLALGFEPPPLEVLSVLNGELKLPLLWRILTWARINRPLHQRVLRPLIIICNTMARNGISLFVADDKYRSGLNVDGIGNNNVRAGDKVILIPSMRYPLVIRQDGNSTRLISPAYARELLDEKRRNGRYGLDKRDLEEFHLS